MAWGSSAAAEQSRARRRARAACASACEASPHSPLPTRSLPRRIKVGAGPACQHGGRTRPTPPPSSRTVVLRRPRCPQAKPQPGGAWPRPSCSSTSASRQAPAQSWRRGGAQGRCVATPTWLYSYTAEGRASQRPGRGCLPGRHTCRPTSSTGVGPLCVTRRLGASCSSAAASVRWRLRRGGLRSGPLWCGVPASGRRLHTIGLLTTDETGDASGWSSWLCRVWLSRPSQPGSRRKRLVRSAPARPESAAAP
jgi:hypothetical protein